MNYHGNHPGGNGRSNEDFDPNSMTLTDFFDSMYRPLRLTGASLNSVRLHQCSMSNLQRFLERVPRLIDLTDDTVARFMAWHIAKGNSPYTANNERHQQLMQSSKEPATISSPRSNVVRCNGAPLAWLASLWTNQPGGCLSSIRTHFHTNSYTTRVSLPDGSSPVEEQLVPEAHRLFSVVILREL